MTVKIEWANTLPTASTYNIYRNSTSGPLGILLGSVAPPTTEFIDLSALATDNYYTISGVVNAVEIFGDQFYVSGGVNWNPSNLNLMPTSIFEYDVSDTASMLDDLGGGVTDGDLVSSINQTGTASTQGRLSIAAPSQMPIYRSTPKISWLEFDSIDDNFNDSANPNLNVSHNNTATLIALNFTPFDIARYENITDSATTDIEKNEFFAILRSSGDPVLTLGSNGFNSSGGYKVRGTIRQDPSAGSNLLFEESQSNPNTSPLILWINWTTGRVQVYKNGESVVDVNLTSTGVVTDVTGVSQFRLMQYTACRFYGLVAAFRTGGDFEQGEISSLTSYMKRKFYGRS